MELETKLSRSCASFRLITLCNGGFCWEISRLGGGAAREVACRAKAMECAREEDGGVESEEKGPSWKGYCGRGGVAVGIGALLSMDPRWLALSASAPHAPSSSFSWLYRGAALGAANGSIRCHRRSLNQNKTKEAV